MKRRSHFLLILCWLAYFAVPLVNGIGQTGVQRITLCTTLGVETYYIDTSSDDKQAVAAQHQSSHSCPCTHFFMDTAYHIAALHVASFITPPPSHALAAPQQRTVSLFQARAPPVYPPFSEDQKLA